MDIVARHVLVTGRVQGVAFRHHTKLRAREAGLVGWVRNLPDGRVEVWLEGARDAVAAVEAWLSRGPALARVDRLDARDVAVHGHARFSVRFDEQDDAQDASRREPRPRPREE